MQVNIYDAKTNLSALLDKAVAGEEIIIARAGTPGARLTALVSGAGQTRIPGARRGGMRMADDFDDALPADFLINEPR